MMCEAKNGRISNQDAQANLNITSPTLTQSLDHTSSLPLTTTFVIILPRVITNVHSIQKQMAACLATWVAGWLPGYLDAWLPTWMPDWFVAWLPECLEVSLDYGWLAG